MAGHEANRNLLLGVLALQMNFLTREQLIAAVTDWISDKSRPLDAILYRQGSLSQEAQSVLGSLVDMHLEIHDGDAERSFAALNSRVTPVVDELRSLGDDDVDATLAPFPDEGGNSIEQTVSFAGARSSDGRFRILRPHAEGGLGRVLVALDEELNREVALKELKAANAGEESRQRFVIEAEVTGGLEHPGIVPVYGLGTYEDGRPYFAMRLVRGENLKRAIRRFHELRTNDPQRNLTFRELLNRFVDVCNAVNYAHSQGVIHRDLKPGNIMLGPYGETLVVDWGLAKATGGRDAAPQEGGLGRVGSGSDATPTAAGSVVGTLQYMSPEQAAGRIEDLGPATDVYSMGAVLCEILCNRPPTPAIKDGEGRVDYNATLKRISEGWLQLPHPAEASRPLIEVCRRALEKEPSDRYGSVAELAEDIERWLGDEPVSAYREPIRKRVNRWMRKHRPLVWGAGTGAAVLIATVVAALGIGFNAVRQEQKRTQAALEAESRRRELTRKVLNTLSESLVDDWLLEQPTLTTNQRRFMQRALWAYEEYAHETRDDPDSVNGLARMYARIGGIEAKLGHTDAAIEELEKSRRLYAELHLSAPGVASRYAAVLRSLATQQRMRGHWDYAETNLQLALTLQTPLLDDPPPEDTGWSSSIAKSTPNYSASVNIGWTQYGLGRLDASRRAYEAADLHFAEALAKIDALKRDGFFVDDLRVTILISRAWNAFHLETGEFDAEVYLGEALVRSRQLSKAFPSEIGFTSSYATALNDLGVLHRRNKRFDLADDFYRQAKEIRETVHRRAPGNYDYAISLGGSHGNIGNLLRVRGKLDEAMAEYERGLEVMRRTGGYRMRWYRRNIYEGKGQVFFAREQWDEAFEQLTKAVNDNRPFLVGHEPTDYLRGRLLQAYALAHLEAWEQSLTVVSDTRTSPDDDDHGLYCYYAARILAATASRSTAEESEGLIEQAVELLNQAVRTDYDYEDELGRTWREDPSLAQVSKHPGFRPPAEEPSPVN